MDKKGIPATWYDSLIKSDSVKNDKGAFWESEIIQIDEKNRKFTNQLELLRNCDKKRESLYESIFHSDRGEVDKKNPTNLEKLIEVLRDPNTEVHYRDRPDNISGRHSIFKILADAFDPVLRLVIAEGRLDWLELDFSGVPIPLANHLVSWDCVKLSADSLKSACTAINLAYESPNNFPIKKAEQTLANRAKPSDEDIDHLLVQGECLQLVSEIFDLALDLKENVGMAWCAACFRRSRTFERETNQYCQVHTAGKPASARQLVKDLAIMKGELHKEGLKSWLQYQSLRKLLLNGFKLSSVGHMPTPPEQHLAHIVEQIDLIEIVEKTLDRPWNEVAPFWEIILGTICPTLNLKFRRPTCFNSWDEFAEHLLEVLEDIFEDTHHPYWLLKILVIAEQWEVFRSNFRDGRTNDTAEKVWKLRDEKMAIQKIASAVEISRQQVSNILKKPRPVI